MLQTTPQIGFAPGFLGGRWSDGRTVDFTRSEARLLSYMAQHSNQVLSRSQILNAISEPGSEKNDRTVDFLINRLRRKLNDNAGKPQFIQTRYGEGYVWVGPQSRSAGDIGDAFAVLGPVRGLDRLGPFADVGNSFAQSIFAALKAEMTLGQEAVILPDFEPLGRGAGAAPHISVELTFFRGEGGAECVVSVRSHDTNRIVGARRHPIGNRSDDLAVMRKTAQTMIAPLLAGYWRAGVSDAATTAPLSVAIQVPAKKPGNAAAAWAITDVRLRALRAEQPDDPATKILYATHLHNKYVVCGPELFMNGTATCAADEGAIENLVLEALEFAQTQPEYAMTAAKLLYFVDAGYRNIALEIMETAHRSHSSVASSLTIFGQMRAFCGQTEAAVDCLEQAFALSPRGTDAHIYTLVLLCQALNAAGDRARLDHHLKVLYHTVPLAAFFFELLFSDPEKPSLRAKATTLMLSKKRARALLMHNYYVSARLFEQQAHRERAMQTPLALFQKRFGRDVVPPEVALLVPNLLP
jgi:hypothetical protein